MGSAETTTRSLTAKPPTFKKGGLVEKTGIAKVHKGEVVIPKKRKKK